MSKKKIKPSLSSLKFLFFCYTIYLERYCNFVFTNFTPNAKHKSVKYFHVYTMKNYGKVFPKVLKVFLNNITSNLSSPFAQIDNSLLVHNILMNSSQL